MRILDLGKIQITARKYFVAMSVANRNTNAYLLNPLNHKLLDVELGVKESLPGEV